jgi:hypothetical protein
MVKRACMWAWPHLCNEKGDTWQRFSTQDTMLHMSHKAGWPTTRSSYLYNPEKGIWKTINVRHVRVGVRAVELERHQTLPNQIRYGHETINTR